MIRIHSKFICGILALNLAGCASSSNGTAPQLVPTPTNVTKDLPDVLEIKASVGAVPIPSFTEDSGSTIVVLLTYLTHVVFSQHIADQLLIERATDREILQPALNGCVPQDFGFAYIDDRISQPVFQLNATDGPGVTKCQEYAASMKHSVIELRYKNVPLRNDHSRILKDVHMVIQPL